MHTHFERDMTAQASMILLQFLCTVVALNRPECPSARQWHDCLELCLNNPPNYIFILLTQTIK